MASITYYVALPLVRDENGDLVGGEAQERPAAHSAIRTAEAMKGASAGAFSRTGDYKMGGFATTGVLQSFGKTSNLSNMVGG